MTVRFTTARRDAQRRDVTTDDMFYDPGSDHVIDHGGGQADLAAGIVRALGDPTAQFAEDR